MKNRKFNLKNYLFNFIVVLFVAALFMPMTPAVAAGSAAVALVSGTALSAVPTQAASFMAIQVEIWQKHIEEELFKDNTFLRFSHNADQNVINSKAVHIPQSGGSGSVVKNRTTLPATIRKRTDTDVIYLLDEFTTDPVVIPDADTHELSYDKRNSVLGEDRDKLVETVADETIYNWLKSPVWNAYGATSLPAGSILPTTGGAVLGTAPSATGNRKAATLKDLQSVKTFLKLQKRWFEGKMYGMLTPAMEAELFPADSVITATYMQSVTEAERREGIMYKVQGFKLMTRSSVTRVQTDGTIIPVDAVGAATDDEAAIFWYKDAVEFAFGGVKAFEQLKDPTMFGDVYSFLARTGSRARRKNYEGIALLRQVASA
jgi:hypothetical protein